jgi:hypothetical protein
MKTILITLLCVILTSITYSQTKKYEVSAEGNALMCPFMGPRLKRQLESNGATNVEKDKALILHFEMQSEASLDENGILEIVKKVGYDPKLFHVKIQENE